MRGAGSPASLLIPLARAELMSGRQEEALRHGLEAQAQFDADPDLRALSSTARLLGDIYTTLGRPGEAVETLERGLELAERVGNVEEIGGCLINLGLAQLALGAFSEATAYNERAIVEFERIGHGSGRALGYSNLAWVLANRATTKKRSATARRRSSSPARSATASSPPRRPTRWRSSACARGRPTRPR